MNEKIQKTEKPWGWFETFDENKITPYKIKVIYINPNHQFSLQRHLYREEHWIVLEGDGILTTSTYNSNVKRGDYIHIRKNEIHRMSAGEFGIKLSEIQIGSLCDENDIVRLEDDYGRK